MEINGMPRDARGRPLQEGDEIILGTVLPAQWRIVKIMPVLDPRVPPGAVVVHLVAFSNLPMKGGERYNNVVRIQTLEEAGPLPFQIMGDPVDPAAEKEQP